MGRSQAGNQQTQAFLSAWNFLGGCHWRSDLTSLDLIFFHWRIENWFGQKERARALLLCRLFRDMLLLLLQMPKSNRFLSLGKVGRVEWSWSFCHSQPLPDTPGCGKWIWHQSTKYWWQDPPASATWNIWTSHKFFPVDKWGMNNFYGLGVIPGIRTCYVGFPNFFILWAWFNQGVRGVFLALLPSQTPSALLDLCSRPGPPEILI